MTQCIVYSQANGQVAVCIPTGELPIEAVQTKDTPKGSIIMNLTDLPRDNDFFDAFELVDGTVTVNKDKAVELTKKRLRSEREPLFAAQDVLFQRNLETDADNSAVVAEKNRLRDITTLATADKSLEELRGLKAGV